MPPPTRAAAKRSAHAASLLSDLLGLPPEIRRDLITGLPDDERLAAFAAAARELGTPYGLYADDMVGFIWHVLGESLWSKSREIAEAVPAHRKVAVPSSFSSSKTHTAARAVLWFANVHPVGTARVVTIAPRWRQVKELMWPEIRNAHARAGLPGTVDVAQLKMLTAQGVDHVVASGLAAPGHREDAVQGIHAPRVLLVVDESGGISRLVGRNLGAMLTNEGTRMLAVGNPPTDDEGGWFETLCSTDDVHVIPIPASASPNISGERAPRCRSCPEGLPPHSLATHLLAQQAVDEAVRDFGPDSPYVQAKVHARFPKGGANRVVPYSWLEAAADADEPQGPEYVALADLDLPEETEPWAVRRGAWVRLGVDVASDGGDEFVIARTVGDLTTIRHASAGQENANSVDVAGVVLREIHRAEALARTLASPVPVRVKVDTIGLGWGVTSTLAAWGSEQVHGAEIVGVDVSERPNREDAASVMRPALKRDEMWLAGRSLAQPQQRDGSSLWRLRVDRRTLAQLAAPGLGTTSTGSVKVESKKNMRARGMPSPDRGEAALLSVYEPGDAPKPRRPKARLIV